ncbi:dUTP diphosphatase [Bacillus zanthoxyli]|nr:dUTP diphosphatase [Bacillus zanthoxyli]
MNLTKLFDMQHMLDQRITDKHPELKETDNLSWKILALQVELGECANEWRGFKKWSTDQRPKLLASRQTANMPEPEYFNPLLEEYVDCLHFILSIGLELSEEWVIEENYEVYRYVKDAWNVESTIEQFLVVNKELAYFSIDYDVIHYVELVSQFLGLGEMLGFTWKQIEKAYLDKNKVNHQRQANGY